MKRFLIGFGLSVLSLGFFGCSSSTPDSIRVQLADTAAASASGSLAASSAVFNGTIQSANFNPTSVPTPPPAGTSTPPPVLVPGPCHPFLIVIAQKENSLKIYDLKNSGSPIFTAFIQGTVTSIATGDLNGDGIPDLVLGLQPARVLTINGANGTPLLASAPYGNFQGGVSVAVGDVNGDGRADLITGALAGGGPHVKAFDGVTGQELLSFMAYDPAFTGGVSVAVADGDIVTGAGPGGGPHVKIFDGRTGATLSSFFALNASFTGGISVAAGDLKHQGRAQVIVAALAGVAPTVRILNAADGADLGTFNGFAPAFSGGVPSVGFLNFGNRRGLLASQGAGGTDLVRIFDGSSDFSLAATLLQEIQVDNFSSGVLASGVCF